MEQLYSDALIDNLTPDILDFMEQDLKGVERAFKRPENADVVKQALSKALKTGLETRF